LVDKKELAKKAAIAKNIKNSNKTYEPVAELTESMFQGIVRRKDAVKMTGEWGAHKFYVEIHDGEQSFRCTFDAVHQNSFEVGDQIGFEAYSPVTNLVELDANELNKNIPSIYRITKRHKICNITRNNGGKRTLVLRPREEITHLREKCEKRYRHLSEEKKKPNLRTEVLSSIIREQKDIAKLGGFLKYIETTEFPASPDADPRQAFKCQLVTKYLGEETLPEVLARAQNRLTVIRDEALQHKEAQEYTDLTKLEVLLRWSLDIIPDSYLGEHFGWGPFSSRLRVNAQSGRHGNDFLIKDRREKDTAMLLEEAKSVVQKQNKEEIQQELISNFSTLAKFGPPPKEDPKKNSNGKKGSKASKSPDKGI